MIFGLGAALGWGVSDLLAAIVARRIGSRATAMVVQVVGLAGFAAFVLATSPTWIGGLDAALLIGSGGLAGIAYFALYRGMELGPVALVSPIASAFAVVTVLLAVVVLGESLPGAVGVGVLLTITGVVLASSDLRRLGREAKAHRRGVPWALAAMACFGVAAFASASYAKEYGWLPPVTLSRIGSVVVVAAVVAATGRGAGPLFERARPTTVLVAIASGVADVLAIASYARGSELGFVSIVVAASATFTLIPVAGGIAFFGERPAPNQLAGVAMVVGGLLLLGVGS